MGSAQLYSRQWFAVVHSFFLCLSFPVHVAHKRIQVPAGSPSAIALEKALSRPPSLAGQVSFATRVLLWAEVLSVCTFSKTGTSVLLQPAGGLCWEPPGCLLSVPHPDVCSHPIRLSHWQFLTGFCRNFVGVLQLKNMTLRVQRASCTPRSLAPLLSSA